jgi:N-acetylornithine carbamoyltransferase
MEQSLKGRDWIETREWTDDELEMLLSTATDLKEKFQRGEPTLVLPHKTVFLIFFDKSTRTRNSFEAGITQLGGHAHYISAETTQIAHGESAKDTGIILSRYGHGIAIRHDLIPGEGNAYMREVAEYATAPVINMQCDIDHPCQTIADLMTIREKFGRDLRGRKIAVSWAYAPSYAKPMSVPQGLITLMTRFGLDVVLAHPPEFHLMEEPVKLAQENARRQGTKFEIVDNLEAAFENAEIVYPKSWGCLELFRQPEESLELAAKYKHWICDQEKMKLTKPDSIYMHCLPADRGYEVTDEVIDGPHSVVYDEAENRLHTAKAIMALTMSGSKPTETRRHRE